MTSANAADLERELDWLAGVLDLRLRLYFTETEDTCGRPDSIEVLGPPNLSCSNSAYAALVRELALGWRERLGLILALAPELRPSVLDVFVLQNKAIGRPFTEFGGARLSGDESFYPTGETLAFVLGGQSLETRFFVAGLLDPDHRLADVLRTELRERGLPPMKAALRVAPEVLSRLTIGREPRPTLSVDFPALRMETALCWDDLVLHPVTRCQVEEVHTWLDHGATLLDEWGMAAKLRPGYRALFHGPPGTGKSMSACLLGAATGRDVYRIDLSMVVSKWIGETEKNLARVFDRAQRRGWILFFDEADALFGKRSETRDSHDRYANQQTAYLLQRIESFDGVVILASNLRDNLDTAFTRRFESVVYFPMPRAEQREMLWRRGLPEQAVLSEGVDLGAIARDYELSGGAIMNVVRQVCLESLAGGGREIGVGDIVGGIRRELAKEGRGL